MGTRFMCTIEAPIHNNIKQAIVDAQETDTELVLRRWRNTSRLFKNKVAQAAVSVEKSSTTGEFSEVAEYVSGKRGRQVFINGDKDFGVSILSCYISPVIYLTLFVGLDRRPSHRPHPRYPQLRGTHLAHRERSRGYHEAVTSPL